MILMIMYFYHTFVLILYFMKLTMKLSYMFQVKARNTPVLILVRIRELQSAFVKNESSSLFRGCGRKFTVLYQHIQGITDGDSYRCVHGNVNKDRCILRV